MLLTRRHVLRLAASSAVASVAGCAHRGHTVQPTPKAEPLKPVDGFKDVWGGGTPNAPAVLILHELPGMTPEDMRLGQLLVDQGFRVYVPRLFGKVPQDKFLRGYFQACVNGPFDCNTKAVRSPVLDTLDKLIDQILQQSSQPLGVIGMCLTGILPLALLVRSEVKAAVLCQPTLPFSTLRFKPTGQQKFDLGLSPGDITKASQSPVPFLAMRYQSDSLCPPERIEVLEKTFPGRMATITVTTGDGHSVLAGSYDDDAFRDTVKYLGVRLGAKAGPEPMKAAKFKGQPCQIDANGNWTT